MPLVVHPHFHPRRTGVTRHVESVVPPLGALVETRVVGSALGSEIPRLGWRELWRRLRHEPVIWHAHRNNELLFGLLLSLIGRRVRVVATRHASHRPSAWTRFLLRRADRVVSLTDEVAAAVPVPSEIVAHGVDVKRFRPPENRSAAWETLGLGGLFGIGVVGRIRPAKGQGDFVEALHPLLAANESWRSVLVGGVHSSDRAWLEGLLATSPGVRWVGEQGDVVPWLQGLQVLVQPSHAEAFSLALMEGLAAGCCVVATRVGGAAQVIEHGVTGYLYDAGDVESLREILSSLMSNPRVAAEVGARAREAACRRFSIGGEARALAQVYRPLLEG